MSVSFSIFSDKVTLITAGSHHSGIVNIQNTQRSVGKWVTQAHTPVAAVWLCAESLNVSTKVEQCRSDTILFENFDQQISGIAFPDCAQIQHHAVVQMNGIIIYEDTLIIHSL